MFQTIRPSSSKYTPKLSLRSVLACILTVGLCMLTFAMPARANDNAVAAYQIPATTRLNTSPVPNFTAQPSAPNPRWSLLPKNFAQPSNPPLSNFPPVSSSSAEPAALAAYSLPRPAPAAPFASATASGSSSGSGHGEWLLLGISGVVVAGVGAVLYAGSRSAFTCTGLSPSNGCNEVRTTGLVLMPVGVVMAVTGFVMRFRH